MTHPSTQFRHRRTAQRMEDRAFFHEILNTATGIVGIADLLRAGDPADAVEFATPLAQLANRIVEEIRSWQVLQAAASGDLTVISTPVDPFSVLNDLQASFCDQDLCNGRTIVVAPEAALGHHFTLQTDRRMLDVVLAQLLKAALATCPPAGAVTLDFTPSPYNIKFTIHSPAAPPSTSQALTGSLTPTAGAAENSALARVRWLATHYLRANLACAATSSGATYVIRCPSQLPQSG